MARAKRKQRRVKAIDKSDSEEDNRDDPNPESEEFFYDDVDKFHKNREKLLLDSSVVSSEDESERSEEIEEVLGLDIDSEDEEDGDDGEENLSSGESDMEKGIPSEKAWGRRKKIYYDADNQAEKDIDSEEEEALNKEEEEEALALQQRMAARMDEQDFDMEEFEFLGGESTDKKANDEAKEEKIIKDLSKLSKEEKLKLLAKDSPELFEIINDFKEKLSEVTSCLYPLVQMARSGKITNLQGIEYLEIKHQLIMNYLLNICFYLLLKANQSPVKNHPVIGRLVQYRELLQKLEPLDVQLHDEKEQLLNSYKESKENATTMSSEQKKGKKKSRNSTKKVKFSKPEDTSKSKSETISSIVAGSKRKSLKDLDPLSYYEAVKEMKKKRKEDRMKIQSLSKDADIEESDEENFDGKRGITYQISKNKGLTPKRKKELRNPRIKHKRKFVKAKIKHKSQVLPVVKEINRYGGEATGIKTHLTRSIKIK